MLKRFSLFAGGSVIGLIVDYLITMAGALFFDINPSLALAMAMIVSATIVFYFHYNVTFIERKENLLRRYVLFMCWSGVVFLLRAIVLNILLYVNISLSIALFLAMVIVAVINYSVSSVFIFTKSQSR